MGDDIERRFLEADEVIERSRRLTARAKVAREAARADEFTARPVQIFELETALFTAPPKRR